MDTGRAENLAVAKFDASNGIKNSVAIVMILLMPIHLSRFDEFGLSARTGFLDRFKIIAPHCTTLLSNHSNSY
jgi:hypothetical protein